MPTEPVELSWAMKAGKCAQAVSCRSERLRSRKAVYSPNDALRAVLRVRFLGITRMKLSGSL